MAFSDDNDDGSLRRLTQGEIQMCRSLYGEYIQYYRVWVHHESYFPFGLQSKNFAMTPNGELYFRAEHYSVDFSFSGSAYENHTEAIHTFMHEMCHVWQYQNGMFVKLRGLFSWAADYHYDLIGLPLSSYSMEQQASIVSDYYMLKEHGYNVWLTLNNNNYLNKYININTIDLLQQYEKTLTHFPIGE